jgi:hypothetical protein
MILKIKKAILALIKILIIVIWVVLLPINLFLLMLSDWRLDLYSLLIFDRLIWFAFDEENEG